MAIKVKLMRSALLSVAVLAAGSSQAQDADMLFDLMCGRTLHYYNPGVPFGAGIGNQIEYTSPDGSAFLWHPNGEGVIIGTWEIERDEDGNGQVCFVYPPGSFNDILAPYQGEPICFDGAGLTDDIVDLGIRNGDPYGLSDGTPPFDMQAHPELDGQTLREQFPENGPATGCVLGMS